MVLVQLWQPVVFCEFFRTCSGDTMWLAFYVRQSGSPPDAKTDGRSAFLESSLLFDDLLQNREFPGLQGTYPALQGKPYANVLLGAVENLNRIIGRRAIDRAAAILLQELKERLTPGMVEEREDFLPDSLHFVAGLMVCSTAARRASVILAMSRFSGSMMVGYLCFRCKILGASASACCYNMGAFAL